MSESPLGQSTAVPAQYSPGSLHAIARADSRTPLGIEAPLPFSGVDVWNAWELTWLGPGRMPEVATAEIRVAAESHSIIESKSLKLYLGSFAMSEHASADAVCALIARDLGDCVGTTVDVILRPLAATDGATSDALPGSLLEDRRVACDARAVEATLLSADAATIVDEELCSDLLRSLCPVTGQPDTGSIVIAYQGPRIDHDGLLRYLVSYREHTDFHESCVERIFVDILQRCAPTALTVHAHYQRRGGIDINPYRTNTGQVAPGRRLWRQ